MANPRPPPPSYMEVAGLYRLANILNRELKYSSDIFLPTILYYRFLEKHQDSMLRAHRAEERAQRAEERAQRAEERAERAERATFQHKTLLLLVLGGTVVLSMTIIWGGKK